MVNIFNSLEQNDLFCGIILTREIEGHKKLYIQVQIAVLLNYTINCTEMIKNIKKIIFNWCVQNESVYDIIIKRRIKKKKKVKKKSRKCRSFQLYHIFDYFVYFFVCCIYQFYCPILRPSTWIQFSPVFFALIQLIYIIP